MTSTLLPILIAATVATFAWWVIGMLNSSGAGSRRKLKERLSADVGAGDDLDGTAGNRSIVVQLESSGLPDFLKRRQFIQKLNRRLLQAYPDRTLGKFILRAAGMGVGVGGVLLLVSASFPLGLAGLIGGAYAPFMLLSWKAAKRQSLISLQLPEALDALTRILRAGHSLSTGLQMLGDELPQPLAGEFRKAYEQHSLGVSMDDALRDTAARIESSDFAFFVTAVLIQRTTGGDLSEVLKNISSMIRGRVRLSQHVRAKTAEGRLTGHILIAFPVIMFLLSYHMNPKQTGMLLHDPTGRMLLAAAVGLQVLGLFTIKKITTVKV